MDDARVGGAAVFSVEERFRLLLEISEKISGTLDLDELLGHLVDTLRSVVGYDAAGIYVIKRDGDQPVIESMVTRGYDSPDAQHDLLLKFGEGLVGYVISTGKSVIIPDVKADPRYVEARRRTRSEMTAPITLNERVIGAFNLESDRPAAFTEADVEVLQFFANAAAISIEKAVLHEELVEKKRIESQLEVARKVQASLLPDKPPALPGYDVAAINLPTYEVGGDYYDYIEFPDQQLGVAIADVSGKGVPAALIMATFRAALRTQVRNDFSLSHVMSAVNFLLWESTADNQFVTAVYGVLDPATGRFTYTNCGHNSPLLLRLDGSIEELNRGGPALGVFEHVQYEESIVTLTPGDALVLYTDGVVEAANEDGKEFGQRRFEHTLRGATDLASRKVIRAIIDATRAFSGTDSYADDFTIVVVKRDL
jgi:sigma-B regulation protein RsbU (phosphoserine phosphatase)